MLRGLRLPKNALLARSVLLLIATALFTFITIDMTMNKSTVLSNSSIAIIGGERDGDQSSSNYGKVYEVMESVNARILSTGPRKRAGSKKSQMTDMRNDTELVLWSTDFHISPIADIKALLAKVNAELGQTVVSVIDKSLSGHCHLTNTCAGDDLKILTKDNGIDLNPCPNKLKRDFFSYYSRNEEFANVDVVVCTHAASLCELYMPFDKAMIVIASTRYEIGRHGKERWTQWNDNLRQIAAKKGNYVAANNLYDKYYIEHFTGIENVLLLPSLATYVKDRAYVDSSLRRRTQVLLAPARDVNPTVQASLESALHDYCAANEQMDMGHMVRELTGATLEIVHIRSLYPRFEYRDLAMHPAVVLLPYQVSFMTLFELYRMNIPLFVPSPELLAQWHVDYGMLKERSWASVRGDLAGLDRSAVESQSASTFTSSALFPSSISSLTGRRDEEHRHHDPNNEQSYEAVHAWVRHADFYSWPHIHTFSSWAELFVKLHGGTTGNATVDRTAGFSRVDLRETSRLMASAIGGIEQGALHSWKTILAALQKRKNRLSRRTHGGMKGHVNKVTGKTAAKQRQEGVEPSPGEPSKGAEKWRGINRELRRRYGYELDSGSCEGIQ